MNIVPKKFYLDSFFNDMMSDRDFDLMRCDIYEKEGIYHIEADIPGFTKSEIKVECNNGYLSITAEKNTENEENDSDKKYLKKERVYNKVQRQFYVGDVEDEKIEASYADGILKVTVPKENKEKNKKVIEIK